MRGKQNPLTAQKARQANYTKDVAINRALSSFDLELSEIFKREVSLTQENAEQEYENLEKLIIEFKRLVSVHTQKMKAAEEETRILESRTSRLKADARRKRDEADRKRRRQRMGQVAYGVSTARNEADRAERELRANENKIRVQKSEATTMQNKAASYKKSEGIALAVFKRLAVLLEKSAPEFD